jgi:hypothetical protein
MKLKLYHIALFAALLAPSIAPKALAGGTAPVDKIDKAALRITGSTKYIAITGLNAPIANLEGFSGMMALDAGLEIQDDKERKRAANQLPRLRDALRRAVHSYLNISYEQGKVPDLDMLGMRLQRAVDGTLGAGIAKVTIASALIHPYS